MICARVIEPCGNWDPASPGGTSVYAKYVSPPPPSKTGMEEMPAFDGCAPPPPCAADVVAAAVVFFLVGVAVGVGVVVRDLLGDAEADADAVTEAEAVAVFVAVCVAVAHVVAVAVGDAEAVAVPVPVPVPPAEDEPEVEPVAADEGVAVGEIESEPEAVGESVPVADFEGEAEAVAVLPQDGLGLAEAAAAGNASAVPYTSDPAPIESAKATVRRRGRVKDVVS
jgi:hypothetical protein